MVKRRHGSGSSEHCCSYEYCPNPTSSRQYYGVLPSTRAGGKDWEALVGKILCHSCYYQYQRKGSLLRDGRERRPDVGGETSSSCVEGGAPRQLIRRSRTTQRCSYDKCGNPEQSRRFYQVDENTHAAGQAWTSLIGMVLCHTCYYQYQRRGTLERQTDRTRRVHPPLGDSDGSAEAAGEGASRASRSAAITVASESSHSTRTASSAGAGLSHRSEQGGVAADTPARGKEPKHKDLKEVDRAGISGGIHLSRGVRISFDSDGQETRYGTVKNRSGSSCVVMWDNGKKSQVNLDAENSNQWRVISEPDECKRSPPSASGGSVGPEEFSMSKAVPFKKRAQCVEATGHGDLAREDQLANGQQQRMGTGMDRTDGIQDTCAQPESCAQLACGAGDKRKADSSLKAKHRGGTDST